MKSLDYMQLFHKKMFDIGIPTLNFSKYSSYNNRHWTTIANVHDL